MVSIVPRNGMDGSIGTMDACMPCPLPTEPTAPVAPVVQEALSGHHAVGAGVPKATRETHKRSLGAFLWVIYWIYLRQQAQGVTAQSKRSKTIYETQDGELTLRSQRVGVKCISSWAKL